MIEDEYFKKKLLQLMQEYDLVYELKSELRYPRWVVWGVVQGENDLEMISMKFSSKLKNTAVWC